MGNFVIYGLFDPVTGELRYVGKSSRGMERCREHLRPSQLKKNTHKAHWLNKLYKQGLAPEVRVLEEVSAPEALDEAERRWIRDSRRRGAPLVNLTEGGDGAPGLKQTQEARYRLSRSQGGRPFCDNLGRVYQTTYEAANALGISQGNVHSVLKGFYRQTHGYSFRYIREGEIPTPWAVEGCGD